MPIHNGAKGAFGYPETTIPITGIRAYNNGTIEVIRKCALQDKMERGTRGEVKEFSKASRERLLLIAKETQIEFLSFITLTYGLHFPADGRIVKANLTKFLRLMKARFGAFSYLWFLEFQARGAPHFHIITDLPAPNRWDRRRFSSIWCDGVQELEAWEYCQLKGKKTLSVRDASFDFHCRPQQWEMVRRKNGVARYCAKYAMKMEQKEVPKEYRNVGRFWGASKYVKKTVKSKIIAMTEREVRQLIQARRGDIADCDIIPRYVFDVY